MDIRTLFSRIVLGRQTKRIGIGIWTALMTWSLALAAATGPAQMPLLTAASGAKPNVVISLDNSGSMKWVVLDTYTVPKYDGTGGKSTGDEYYNWSCQSGYTGPYRDDADGKYYCLKTTVTTVCPSGFSGPYKGTGGRKYCTKQVKSYSCPAGYTGPTVDQDGQQICSKPAINYSCSNSNYQVTGTSDADRTCTAYSCNWDRELRKVGASYRCEAYYCNKYKGKTYTLEKDNSGKANCRRSSTWIDWLLAVNSNSWVAATETSNSAYLVATPYTDVISANSTPVDVEYDNVQNMTKLSRDYGSSPYTAGALRASKRTGVATGSYYAMRSPQVNPLYYDPNKTYTPRVNYTGSGKYAEEEKATDYFVIDWQSSYETSNSDSDHLGYPKLERKSIKNLSKTDKFTSVLCSGYREAECTVNGTDSRVVDVTITTKSVPLPLGNARTDCGPVPATYCTGLQERQNILNWYNYYRTRSDIAGTSIGFALANPIYDGKMRIGYYNINHEGDANKSPNWRLGLSDSTVYGSHGVLDFSLGSDYAHDVYNWLYNQSPDGKTPLHNAIYQVGKYYKKSQPWRNDPTQTGGVQAADLSCRRAYNILFSDGAWNGTSISTDPVPYNQTGLKPAKADGTGLAALSPAFAYNKNGDSDNLSSYTAYPDSGSGNTAALAALTGQYYWGLDLQDDLANKVATRAGEPTSWQNMKTYTVGYGIAPTGFTFDDVKNWQKMFPKVGYQSDIVPAWATDLNGDKRRIDDFIHAGYTGGGAGYSVRSADDIRRAFDTILSDVVSASGNDAGVAVSGASSTVSTIEGSLKYTVDYKTLDNSGDVKAWKLDAKGSNATVNALWSANNRMPMSASRNLSTLSAAGNPVLLGHTTRLDALPADIQTALKAGKNNLPADASFIQYLRGEDGIADTSGNIFRRRAALIGASVNAPPAYVGGRLNMGYDRSLSGVAGKNTYDDFITLKGQIPGTIYAPTNDGQVHVFNAADDAAIPAQRIKNTSGSVIEPGVELWSYLIRGSQSKMQAFADSAYQFEYVLDGPVAEHDIYDGVSSSWKQMVFGTMGRAAKGGVYGLNAPLNQADTTNLNRIPDQSDYKWEVSPADMGYVTNAITAGQTPSGHWVLLVSSGHYAGTNKAGLYVLDAKTGATIRFLQLPTTSFGRGLGGVTAVRDTQRRVVAAYAGDDGGNLWRFDLLDADPQNWVVSYNRPIFTTASKQPIYVAPAWAVHPGDGQAASGGCIAGQTVQDADGNTVSQQCGAMVVFGTGMMMDADDQTNNASQAIYGIWDKTPIGYRGTDLPTAAVTQAELLVQTIDLTKTAGQGAQSDKDFYKVSNNAADWKTHRGWSLTIGKLPNSTGERVIGDVFNLGSSVFISSVVPNAPATTAESCLVTASPPNYLYGLDALTGGLKRSFDQNGDGKADQFSIAYLAAGGFTRGSVITQVSKNTNSTAGLGLPTEGSVDLQPKSKCTGEQGYDTGINGSMQVFDACPAGWTRAWRQILVPPTF